MWAEFKRLHLQADGRVIDNFEGKAITTSEGQAYALFFAVVADDRRQFDLLWRWTVNNLMQGDESTWLPAWKWGKDETSGSWKVLDANSASDADVWIAYSLLQAAQRWNSAEYRKAGMQLLGRIARREVVDLPGVGWMMLPASYGYALAPARWRVNPSYLPIQVMRYFAKVDAEGPWCDLITNTEFMLGAVAGAGGVPDWVVYTPEKGFQPDPEMGRISGYEAIRVYLWWGMLDHSDQSHHKLRPLMQRVQALKPGEATPERINIETGATEGKAPEGFDGALTPLRKVLYGDDGQPRRALSENQYYSSVLKLFGYGWLDGRFKFCRDGSLVTKVSKPCLN
jgi:endoglucanase